jgi:hypothetical protein
VPDEETIWISSGADAATGKGLCLLEWGPVRKLIAPEVVLDTARDLQAAASSAENDIALLRVLRDELDLDTQTVFVMIAQVRAARPMPPGTPVLRIEAVAGERTELPYVHIGRGSMKASLSPDAAREMALHWTATAVASQVDARLRYVLGEYDQLAPREVDEIFAAMRQAGGRYTRDATPEPNTHRS